MPRFSSALQTTEVSAVCAFDCLESDIAFLTSDTISQDNTIVHNFATPHLHEHCGSEQEYQCCNVASYITKSAAPFHWIPNTTKRINHQEKESVGVSCRS